MSTIWTSRYARCAQRVKSSTIRELLKISERPEIISFAGGLPAPELFPLERFQAKAVKQHLVSSRAGEDGKVPALSGGA